MPKNKVFNPADWPPHLNPQRLIKYLAAQGIKKCASSLASERSRGTGYPFVKIMGQIYYRRDDIQYIIDSPKHTDNLKKRGGLERD